MSQSSQANTSLPDVPLTLLSTLQKHIVDNEIYSPAPSSSLTRLATHPFATGSEIHVAALRDLIDVTNQLTSSLNHSALLSIQDPKLLSLLRQQATLEHTLHVTDQNVRRTISSFRNRLSTQPLYGEDIPVFPEPRVFADWCLSRIEKWAANVCMETFKDENPTANSRVTLVLGGKVIVIDIDLNLGIDSNTNPQISPIATESSTMVSKLTGVQIMSLKTSFALDGTTMNGNGDKGDGLDAFLTHSLSTYLETVRKGAVDDDLSLSDKSDTQEVWTFAARLAHDMQKHLSYLMMLDKLAVVGGNYGGVQWFLDTDRLSATLERLATQEAGPVASALTMPAAPLDIFLVRAHSLPLPYLVAPAISFLVHVSPLSYLTLLRSSTAVPRANNKNPLKIDIPTNLIRTYVTTHPRPPGITLANLVLVALEKLPVSSGSEQEEQTMDVDSGRRMVRGLRPTFPLLSGNADLNHVFPHPPSSIQAPSQSHHTWFLDFTSGGQCTGVVITKGRLHAIENTLRVLRGQPESDSGVDNLGVGSMENIGMTSMGLGGMGGMGFGMGGPSVGGINGGMHNELWSGSWIDLLFTGSDAISYARYRAVYRSPSNVHPPVELHLNTPQEPGLHLDRIPVRNMKEVWATLEIIKEQCWLNDMLSTIDWAPDSPPYYVYGRGSAVGQPSSLPKTVPPASDDSEVTSEETFQALLSGTYRPKFISATVFVPSLAVPYMSIHSNVGPPPNSAHDSLFDSPTTGDMSIPGLSTSLPDPQTEHMLMGSRIEPPPSIAITTIEREDMTGVTELKVVFDAARPRGVRVELGGTLEARMETGTMEEVCRRGGLFGLPGRAWKRDV